MMHEKEPKVFVCDTCKKPKTFKSMSSKLAGNGEPICRSCLENEK
jgi:formylmethanofuran dehydrogenase subunit E